MKDDIFNTLLAVAVMCMGHYHGTLDGRTLEPVAGDTSWDKGFENCAVVLKRRDAERERRSIEATANQQKVDKARVANAIAALDGRKFEAEPAPPEPRRSNTCIMETSGVSDMMPLDHMPSPRSYLAPGNINILTPGKSP